MSLLENLLREQVRRRMYGDRHRRSHGIWGPSPRHGHRSYGMWGRPSRRSRYGRSRTQVRGCGCCLPIPIVILTVGAAVLRLALGRLRR